ncbi:MAG: NAD(P)H-dependent glycerol-3-phosphate dehydrogenase [Clostridia bacterium]|jgi:glycerol-3-phosphate dehydrogenase (NAD(P)+)|nr:NAD(P)H-dependent glycerol-3-phosphate dehydrogenase [Clostridia bacterium]
MKVSVLGCGRWGSFLAWYNNRLGNEVVSFGPEHDYSYQVLKNTGRNEYVRFDRDIRLTCDLDDALGHADTVIISISSQGLRGFASEISKRDIRGKKFVLCMKGIEETTGKRLSEVAIESGIPKENVAVWSGPGHIQEFTKNVPNCMVIDSYNPELTRALVQVFKSDLIRFYYGNDIIGTEVGAATKNIMGIVAGVLDGLNYASLKGPLMARGAREVARLIKALGGNELSAYGLCHLGDYETTLFSLHSHNRKWGEAYVLGQPFEKLAEGVATARAVAGVAAKLGVDMPITNAVNEMIRKHTPPKDLLATLFERDAKEEFI